MAKRNLPDILTDSEERALLGAFNRRYRSGQRNRTMVLLALRTGMRIGEVLALRWEDIELDTGRVHLKHGKGDKDRVLWLSPPVLEELTATAAKMGRERSGLVFTTDKGGELDAGYCRRMIATYAKRAGIAKRVHFHLCRHTYLSKLYARTHDIRVTQQVAGHADISTTQIYTHVSGEDVRAAMIGGDRD